MMVGAAPEDVPLTAWAGNADDDPWSAWNLYSRREELNASVANAVSTVDGYFIDPATLAQQLEADLVVAEEDLGIAGGYWRGN